MKVGKMTMAMVIMLVAILATPTLAFASEQNKYAKVYKLNCTKYGSGIRTTLTFPSAKTFRGSGDYINFYLGMHGFECGIPTACRPEFKDSYGRYRWHWFVNHSYGSYERKLSGPMAFSDGDTVNIELKVDSSSGRVKFIANGVTVFTSRYTYSNYANNLRLVCASSQTYSNLAYLPSWGVFHNQVVASRLMYKTTYNSWNYLNEGNTANPPYNRAWPTNGYNRDYRTYVATPISNATVYASLKNY